MQMELFQQMVKVRVTDARKVRFRTWREQVVNLANLERTILLAGTQCVSRVWQVQSRTGMRQRVQTVLLEAIKVVSCVIGVILVDFQVFPDKLVVSCVWRERTPTR